jgi:hypothetical protein
MTYVDFAAYAAEGILIAALSAAMRNLYTSANSVSRMSKANGRCKKVLWFN